LVARETGAFDEALQEYERALQLMWRTGSQAGVADIYRMMARTYATRRMWDEGAACAQTSLEIAQRLGDDLRLAGAMYVLAGVREEQARIQDAITLFERVVQYDRLYQLPKLQENIERLAALRERQARDSLKGETEPA
jgi:tetratricopeptide (TPR) repeat protein